MLIICYSRCITLFYRWSPKSGRGTHNLSPQILFIPASTKLVFKKDLKHQLDLPGKKKMPSLIKNFYSLEGNNHWVSCANTPRKTLWGVRSSGWTAGSPEWRHQKKEFLQVVWPGRLGQDTWGRWSGLFKGPQFSTSEGCLYTLVFSAQ